MSDKITGLKEPAKVETSSKPASPGRRRLLRWMGHAAVAAVTSGVAISQWGKDKKTQPSEPELFSQPTIEHRPIGTEAIENERKQKLDEILLLKLNSPERRTHEQQYLTQSTTLEDIDLGLDVCIDKSVRMQLLDKRWELRKNGRTELKKLEDTDLQWANRNGIHPEVMALCFDNYHFILHAMEMLQKQGSYSSKVPENEMVISPYGMAMIAQTESGGLINIGKYPAASEINTDEYRIEYSSLVSLLDIMRHETGLSYRLENIPGSENPQTEKSSGGALGVMQIMPSSVLEKSTEFRENFFPPPLTNPFNIKWSLLAATMLLAEKGYNATDKQKVEKALLAWNNDKSQAQRILKADLEYRDSISKRTNQQSSK
jgi:hypothetical protein